MAISKRILIVEDEVDIQNILKVFLEESGYLVETAGDGLEGITLFRKQSFDLVLLDIMLPKIDGYVVCEMIRQESNLPVIMLTALDDEDDQIRGFDLKVDDYITKPFSISLVLKRVEAVLRRTAEREENGHVLTYGEIFLDLEGYGVTVAGIPVPLTNREFEVLKLLLENQGRVFTRENLLNQIWGYEYAADEKIVNTHIKNLRKKLGIPCIETVRGVGYKIDKEA